MPLEINNNNIRIWRSDEEGDWQIDGRRNLIVDYHPDWQADVEVLISSKRKDGTPIEFRLLVLTVETQYKPEVYKNAILYSVADKFRLRLWDCPPFLSKVGGLG